MCHLFPLTRKLQVTRVTYLAALGYAQFGKDNEAKQDEFLKQFLANVAVFDTGGRGATTSFVGVN